MGFFLFAIVALVVLGLICAWPRENERHEHQGTKPPVRQPKPLVQQAARAPTQEELWPKEPE